MTNFKIDIVSDTVCPWCYVGHKRLASAIRTWKSTHPSDTFTTTYHAFYLDPSAPTTSIEKSVRYAEKFGAARTEQMFARLAGIGASEGIKFRFGGKTGNTRDSHRVIELAKVKGGSETEIKVVESLFRKYFEEEQDITSRQVLVSAAVEAGIPAEEAEEWLASGKGGKEVDREVQEAVERGISGVPFFTIGGLVEVSGAQDVGVFLGAFERVKGREG